MRAITLQQQISKDISIYEYLRNSVFQLLISMNQSRWTGHEDIFCRG